MKRTLVFILVWLCVMAGVTALADEAEDYPVMPAALQFEQKYIRQKPRDDTTIIRLEPTTSRAEVDEELRSMMAAMEEKASPLLPKGGKKQDVTRLTVGPVIGRSGTKWMSFRVLCNVCDGREQVYVDFDTRAYDMETGRLLTLADFFPADSEAWQVLADGVRQQLTDYFRTETPDAAALDALCTREALEQAKFSFTAGTLLLTYRADCLYPGHNTLMHVRFLFPDLWPMMTEEARAQTDNRCYRLVALTFDDGCARNTSLSVANRLQQYGANATFFVVGESMAKNHHVLAYEHDAGFTIGSHNYKHVYDKLEHEKLLAWKEQYDVEMDSIIGIRPPFMRAPGGVDRPYIRAGVNLPMIHWSLISGDAEQGKTYMDVFLKVVNVAENGSIVLMHDANQESPTYVSYILPTMQERGFVFVSVEELLALNGIPLEPNLIYFSGTDRPLREDELEY